MTERAFVTGSQGFIGQHLIPRLVADNVDVYGYDRKAGEDVLHPGHLIAAMQVSQPTVVYHLAGLADVSRALTEPLAQLEQNCLATLNVLEAMRVAHVPRIVFTSTAVVYGDWEGSPVYEDARGNTTSVYGAMKLASEALIQAYCVGHGFRADIFRLVSLLGAGYRHGNLLDFYRRLKTDPTRLELRGSPTQEKYYCDVGDFIDAVRLVDASHHAGAETWNVSAPLPVRIQDSIDAVCDVLGVAPIIDGHRARWPGDQPQVRLSTAKLAALGWTPTRAISDSLRRTVCWFVEARV